MPSPDDPQVTDGDAERRPTRTVSALTLGGGGISGAWGGTDRAEAVATVHAALDAGITMLDVAPTYGADHEAERVAGAALTRTAAHDGPLITTKVELPTTNPATWLNGRQPVCAPA